MKRIDVVIKRYGDTIIRAWETKSGTAVLYYRWSKVYPRGIDYLGPRGGFLGSQLIRPDGTKTRIDWEI